jgi:hypothetical protein
VADGMEASMATPAGTPRAQGARAASVGGPTQAPAARDARRTVRDGCISERHRVTSTGARDRTRSGWGQDRGALPAGLRRPGGPHCPTGPACAA